MVKEIKQQNKIYFYCEDCKLLYVDKNWAEKCEQWCKKNNTCNINITNHSIKKILEKP